MPSLLDKLDSIKDDSKSGDGNNKWRSIYACIIVGGVAGLMIGYKKSFNLFYSAIGGAAIGGAAGAIFTPRS